MKVRLDANCMIIDSANSSGISDLNGFSFAERCGVWMSANDSSGNIRLAVHNVLGSNSEFWPGPLQPYTEISANPSNWNKTYKTGVAEVKYHRAHYNDNGYTPSAGISAWPGSLGTPYAEVLAPFVDNEVNDKIYNPSNGDFPYLLSDETVFGISNDRYSTHAQSNSLPLGVELHTEMMGFDTPDSSLGTCVLVRYSVFNRSNRNYNNFRLSAVINFKIGSQVNEYLGTDVVNQTLFAINDTSEATFSNQLVSLGCMAVNKRISSSIYFENTSDPVNGMPTKDTHYVRLMRGTWKNGQPMKYGGNGVDASGSNTKFVYPYNTDASQGGIMWSDNDRYQPGKRFGVLNFDSISLKRGEAANFDVVYFIVKENSFNIQQISEKCLTLRGALNTRKLLKIDDIRRNKIQSTTLYPNPVKVGDKMMITGVTESITSLTLISNSGMRIELKNFDISDNSIILPNDFSAGMYIMEIKTLNTIEHQRILINQ